MSIFRHQISIKYQTLRDTNMTFFILIKVIKENNNDKKKLHN
jgi:hypothetical protein